MFYLFTSNNLEKLRMNPFKGLIEEELERFEKRLDEVLVADVDLAHDIARYMSTLKGKRLRPALALLSGQAAGLPESEQVIEAAVAVSFIMVLAAIAVLIVTRLLGAREPAVA